MTNEIMSVNANNNDALSVNTNDFQIGNDYICTLDLTELSGKLALASALNGAVSMKDKTGELLDVEHFVTTPGVRSRTGESCTNTYLILTDGTTYFTQSDGIKNSVQVIVATFTDNNKLYTPPTKFGVKCEIREEVLPNGNTLKKLIPVLAQ